MFVKNDDGTQSWIVEDTTPATGTSVPITAFALSYKQVEALRDLPEDKE